MFQALQKLVSACLGGASAAGQRSIAFPAIGTGGLGVPPATAARWMMAAMSTYTGGSLNEARVVLYDRDRESRAVIAVRRFLLCCTCCNM